MLSHYQVSRYRADTSVTRILRTIKTGNEDPVFNFHNLERKFAKDIVPYFLLKFQNLFVYEFFLWRKISFGVMTARGIMREEDGVDFIKSLTRRSCK